jgi:hypothetical protein
MQIELQRGARDASLFQQEKEADILQAQIAELREEFAVAQQVERRFG